NTTLHASLQRISVPRLRVPFRPRAWSVFRRAPARTVSRTRSLLDALPIFTPAGLASLPVNLQAASLDHLAKVTATQSEAPTTIVVGGLSLPSINALLKSLGVDLNAQALQQSAHGGQRQAADAERDRKSTRP